MVGFVNFPLRKKVIAVIAPSCTKRTQGAVGISKKMWHSDPTRSIVGIAWFPAAQAQSVPISEWGSAEDQG